jgi:membrane associated rhomboid family serine protease
VDHTNNIGKTPPAAGFFQGNPAASRAGGRSAPRPCGLRDAVVVPPPMGLADRDYQRNRPSGGGAFAQLTPVVKWLLIANLGIYFVELLLKGDAHDGPLRTFGAFAIQSAVFEGRIWEFITFQFLHATVGHVLFNCVPLFFFGPFLERWWGSARFLIFYLLCGAAGGMFFTLLFFLGALPSATVYTGLVGASAGLCGILIGIAMIAPTLRVALLLPPIVLSMRHLALALLAIAAGSVLLQLGGNEGGEAGHLGGAIMGYFLVRFPGLLGGRKHVEILPPTIVRPPEREAKIRPRSDAKKFQDSRVDEILDKISRDGFQSLTQEERDFLQEASKAK